MRKLFGNKLGWLAILAVAGAGAFFLGESKPSVTEDSRTIESETIARGDITRSIAATGRVKALVTVEVGSQLSGKVSQLYVDFNDIVKKGDIVAEIDPQTFEQRVFQAEADVESARANVKVMEASAVRAGVTLGQAERDYERQASLARDGAISDAALDATRSARDGARAGLAIAEAQIENAKATEKQRAGALANTEIDLARTKIRSPIDGVVIQRNVDRGQTVAASLSAPVLFQIAQDLTEIQIEANVDESDIGRVRAGNSVTFSVDAHEDQLFRGTVNQVRLSPTEINNVVTYAVIVNAANPRLLLLPGMTANLEIKTGERSDVLRLPNQALRVRATEQMKAQAEAVRAEFGAQRGPGSRGDHGGRSNRQRLLEEIGVDSAMQQRLGEEIRTIMQAMRGQSNEDSDRNALREAMRARVQNVLKANLSSDQMRDFLALQRAQTAVRHAQVWVTQADGTLLAVMVRLGIADDNYSEIVGGQLDEGAEIVTRIRQARR